MARRISGPAPQSAYPHMRRIAGLFAASLKTPTAPTLVGEKIRDIVDSGTWQLRHPVGPDAEGFLQWRAGMNDEQWVKWNAVDDDAWFESVQRDFGLDARPGAREAARAEKAAATI